MRIVADLDLCQGHAVCAAEAPEVFTVPNRGKVEVLDTEPAPAARTAVTDAVRYCPTQALSIIDGDQHRPTTLSRKDNHHG
ncbi:ferredoxin [Nocardia jejuensis]|uniref:ferredoxin n=1 Tax=Nocardia jejuensis TaxID=328049 RepID=UPI00083530F3|nr:ferredoxin [Nocardia jejuensis]